MTPAEQQTTGDRSSNPGQEGDYRTLEREIRQEMAERRLSRIRWAARLVVITVVVALVIRYAGGVGADIVLFGLWGTAVAESVIHRRRDLAVEVAEGKSPAAVGALAMAHQSKDTLIRRAAARGLKRLLPLVREEHRGEISPEGQAALVALLRSADTVLVLGSLQALGEVGGFAAAPAVEHLAKGGNESSWWRHAHIHGPVPLNEIRATARACLERIRRRAEEERERSRLLRPSEPDAAHLLRPAIDGHSGDPATLLHTLEQ